MKKIKNTKYLVLFTVPILSVFLFRIAVADEKSSLPIWEVGLGAGAIHQPYYTGTKQTRSFLFPVVIPTYRGKIFKSDDKGIRAQLFKNEKIKLDLSADFNLAIKSNDIDLRVGMDDIDNVLQLGPSIEVSLNKNGKSRWLLNVPIRGVFKIGNNLDFGGVNISPNLLYQYRFPMLNTHWTFGASAGPQFGTDRYHSIYYGVDKQFKTDDRQAYKASGGYSGSRIQLTLKSKNDKQFVLWFLRYENIDGASFDDSPLVETNNNLTIGFLYSRSLLKSKRRVNIK